MKNTISKKFLVASISLSVIVAVGIGFACGWSGEEEDNYNSFFAPEVSGANEFEPFFKTWRSFYGDVWVDNNLNNFDSTNISEWKDFFATSVDEQDINYILYKSRLGEIDTLIFYLKNKSHPIKPYLKRNSVALAPNAKEFLFYTGFARRCEVYSSYAPDWWDESDENNPKNDISSIRKLIEGAKKQLPNIKSDFIRDRYLYQIIRLYYYAGDYKECTDFYEANKAAFMIKNTIPYRAMGYAAGAFYKMKEYGKANYFYSLCYDSCSELKLSSYLSFHPQEENDWKECLALATDSRQKQVLWHLLGIYADPLRAMKEIYALDPKSDLLDVLLVRAINQEEEFFTSSYKLADNKINQNLADFVKNVADKKNSTKPYLWNLAAGYLYTVSQDFKKGESYLLKAEAGAKNDALVRDQIHIIRLIAKIEQYSKPNQRFEQEMDKELTWLENYNEESALRTNFTYDWMLSRLSSKYLAAGDTARGTLLSRETSADFYRNHHKAELITNFMENPNKNAFDAHIAKIYPITLSDIVRFRAINAFYAGNAKEAVNLFEKYPEAVGGDLPADPFLIHINDCHDCDHEQGTENPYNSQTLLKKILELESQLTPGNKQSANICFLLANAYYNLSYFGNSRPFYYCAIPAVDEYEWSPENPVMDCTKALAYYKKALELSTSAEFKAKCCFMAAKCEQNNLYLAWPADYKGDFKSGTYFRKLKAEYSKTRYYQEIVKECGYFSTYVSANRN